MRNVRTLNMFQKLWINWRNTTGAAPTNVQRLVTTFAGLGALFGVSFWLVFIGLNLIVRGDFWLWLAIAFGVLAVGQAISYVLAGQKHYTESAGLLGTSNFVSLLLIVFGAGINNAALAFFFANLLITLAVTVLHSFSKTTLWGEITVEPTEMMISIGRLENELDTVRATFDSLEEGLLLTDSQDKVIRTNRFLNTLFGFRAASEDVKTSGYNNVFDWMNRVRGVVANPDEFKTAFLNAREMVRRGETGEVVFGVEKPNPRYREQTAEAQRPTLPALPENSFGRNLPLLPVNQVQDEPEMLFERDTRSLLYCEMKLKIFPVVGPKGNLLGVCYLTRDVTEEREVEQLKDNFISIVSHEVRTPMAVILGMTELLALPGVERSEQEEWIQAINEEALRLRTVLQDMQSMTRIKEGAVELSNENVDLAEVIERVVKVSKAQYRAQHTINVQFDIPSSEIMADRGKVTQVLTNLIGNAIKYTPEQGEIKIQVGLRPQNADQLYISVTDQGIGIPQTEKHKVFSRFFRSTNTRQKGIGGTGLGLAITRHLVKLMGGEIWFESEENKGSTFYFSLPFRLPENPQIGQNQTPRTDKSMLAQG